MFFFTKIKASGSSSIKISIVAAVMMIARPVSARGLDLISWYYFGQS